MTETIPRHSVLLPKYVSRIRQYKQGEKIVDPELEIEWICKHTKIEEKDVRTFVQRLNSECIRLLSVDVIDENVLIPLFMFPESVTRTLYERHVEYLWRFHHWLFT